MTMSINGTSGITFPDGSTQSTAASSEFAAGTKLTFQQTSAPTGWTKSTTYDNYAMRLVSGSVSSGGSVAFTTAFASQTPSGSVSVSVGAGTLAASNGSLGVNAGSLSVGATTLDTSQMPSHSHTLNYLSPGINADGGASSNYGTAGTAVSGATGGGGSHTHSISGSPSLSGSVSLSGTPSVTSSSFSGNAINLAVQYLDFILATKN